jgi:predicted transcriptional regulator
MEIADEDLLDVLGDRYTRAMLKAMDRTSKSAQEISLELGIPLTSCYRRIRILERGSLIELVESRLMPNRKRVNYYRSRIRSISIVLDRDLIVRISA